MSVESSITLELEAFELLEKAVEKGEDIWQSMCDLGIAARQDMDRGRFTIGDGALLVSKKYGENRIGAFAAEIGVREIGTNRGPRVETYLASVGLPPGNPWCAAFVAWCIQQAALRRKATVEWPRTGYCPSIAAWAKRMGKILTEPQPGQVFLLRLSVGGTTRFAHTGIVERVQGEILHTIEGNTNERGGREGIGVFERTRTLGPDLVFIVVEPD